MQWDFVTSEGHGVSVLQVDATVYPLKAILKTAYWFTDRCYLHLQYGEGDIVEIRFKGKPGRVQAHPGEEFMNRLLDQTLRDQIAAETAPLRNLIVAHALSKTCLISPELERVATSEDPLNIAVPDERKSS